MAETERARASGAGGAARDADERGRTKKAGVTTGLCHALTPVSQSERSFVQHHDGCCVTIFGRFFLAHGKILDRRFRFSPPASFTTSVPPASSDNCTCQNLFFFRHHRRDPFCVSKSPPKGSTRRRRCAHLDPRASHALSARCREASARRPTACSLGPPRERRVVPPRATSSSTSSSRNSKFFEEFVTITRARP